MYVTMADVFPNTWACYMRQHDDNQVALQLKKLKENQALTSATKEVTSVIDLEEAVKPETILEMVSKSRKKGTKQLKQDVSNLTSQIKELKNLLTKKYRRGNAGPV